VDLNRSTTRRAFKIRERELFVLLRMRKLERMIADFAEEFWLPYSSLLRSEKEYDITNKLGVARSVARAIALKTRLVACDEPTSALDTSVQNQTINLLFKLRSEYNMSYLFILHNLDVVRYLSDRIYIMYLGNIMEEGDSGEVFSKPLHPYAVTLMHAIPDWNPIARKFHKLVLEGEPTSPINPPSGCPFHPRCPFAQNVSKEEKAALLGDNHKVACHFPQA